MLINYVLGGSLGGLVAFMFAIPAILLEITESGKVKNVPLLVDVKTIFGLKIRHKQEVFFIGLLLHLIFGFLFGFVYVLFVEQGWLFITHAPYTIFSLIVFAFLSWVVVGVIIYPLLGLGMFGLKEGPRVWLETLTSHFILAFFLWLLVQYFQPFFFNPPLY
ncbi:MAG: hypothetical protein UT30_C0003G0018 [Candidatus Uhrbacteria bacterium GW2011_GWF2_39_13]|uniref:Uncharacterized protein n=1 Tax=Candidatus Uhrbacteria bacterium GW2011_GWF2_39_13 TaxID=1618995 RepID=A0A0G0MLE0_9BACT|nr:MAG: hypothetical protein UT30_C0003G0018 [Candidatus Uhrbacteria bacterium GW2011_GWF2_39_13]HAU66259.1 hypothetical protein [Candidatus Uhrbacteria bacterium]